ncbi:hypothetical protein K439DRAFT_1641839 [Ramaria rubella]|nr:hypothetical protein K439DRAFT_1641839 [Ramaria rubella]
MSDSRPPHPKYVKNTRHSTPASWQIHPTSPCYLLESPGRVINARIYSQALGITYS